jgi:VWFA-related protein
MRSIKMCFIAIVMAGALAFSLSQPVAASLAGQTQNPPKQKEEKGKKQAEDPEAADDQTIKLGTQLVTVPFNVTDKKNRYINDLTKDDIEILEDNKPQKVFSFERQTDLPITIAMLIDISGSQSYTLPIEKAAAQRFLRRVLRPSKDIAAVATFEHEAVLVQNFTSDVEKLSRAIDSVQVPVAAPSVYRGGTPPINGGSRVGSTALFDAIYAVSSDLLRNEAGRRVLILISDGVNYDSRVKLRDAIERTWRNEVITYSIGIGDPGYSGVDEGTLKKIAAETGGRAFFPRNEEDLDKAFALIDEDLRSQYVLAYEPLNEAQDGSFRTIQLKVKTRKDLVIRHRRGYFAPKESSD